MFLCRVRNCEWGDWRLYGWDIDGRRKLWVERNKLTGSCGEKLKRSQCWTRIDEESLGRCDDSISKQAILWMPHGYTEEENDQRTTPGNNIWRRRCGQQDTSRRKMEAAAQNRAEYGEEWSVVYVQHGATGFSQMNQVKWCITFIAVFRHNSSHIP